ncbi:hypothetical protein Ancab_002567 [Ancistrocladus abbreviatus]
MRSYTESRQWLPGSLRGHRTYKEVVTEIPKKVDSLHEGGANMQNDGIRKPDRMMGGLSESRDEGGPGVRRAAVDLGGSGPSVSEAQSKKARKGKVKASLNLAGKPIVVGLKLSKKPKTPKPQSKLNKKRPVPTEVDLSCVRTERCVTSGPAEVAQVSGASLRDSNIENMNRVLLKKMATEEPKAIWAIGKRLGVQSNEEELTVIQHIAQLQSRP